MTVIASEITVKSTVCAKASKLTTKKSSRVRITDPLQNIPPVVNGFLHNSKNIVILWIWALGEIRGTQLKSACSTYVQLVGWGYSCWKLSKLCIMKNVTLINGWRRRLRWCENRMINNSPRVSLPKLYWICSHNRNHQRRAGVHSAKK